MTDICRIGDAGLILAVLFISGCATVTDVVPNEEITLVSGNVYETLDVDHRGVFGSEDSLQKNVFERAEKFAQAKGMVANPLAARIHRVGVFGDWAWYYLKFQLVEPGSPDAYRNITDIEVVRDPRLAPDFYAARNKIDEAPARGAYDDFRDLDKLRKEGLLTDAEFEAEKQRLLKSQK